MIDIYNKIHPVLRVMIGILGVGIAVGTLLFIIDYSFLILRWMMIHPLQAVISFFIVMAILFFFLMKDPSDK
jgi:hypothetical protein